MEKKFKKWQDAFKAKGLDPKALPDVSMIPERYRKPQHAQYILSVVVEFLNDDWEADYTDTDQDKWEIWWKVLADNKRKSGFCLSLYCVDRWTTHTAVGVRFAFKNSATARYAATHPDLKKLWEDLYLPYQK